MKNLNFLQMGNFHCFGCHLDFLTIEEHENCPVKEKTPFGCDKCRGKVKLK